MRRIGKVFTTVLSLHHLFGKTSKEVFILYCQISLYILFYCKMPNKLVSDFYANV